jgi:hypothetical protein
MILVVRKDQVLKLGQTVKFNDDGSESIHPRPKEDLPDSWRSDGRSGT